MTQFVTQQHAVHGNFLNTDISQGSVATRLRRGGVFYICYKFRTESNSERILKISQYLVKLWARVRCLVFLTHGVVPVRPDKGPLNGSVLCLGSSCKVLAVGAVGLG